MKSMTVAFVLAFVAAVPSLAHAQSADAQKLFDEGKALMKTHALDEACTKFEQSDKLDPGVGTELWLADCYERNGKLVAAYKQYSATEKLAVSLQDHRDAVAHKRASALLSKVSKLVVTLPAARPIEGIELRVDGAVAASGDAVVVDPGTHLVEASAPGYEHWESKVLVGGDTATVGVVVEPLVRKVVEAAAPAAEAPPAPALPASDALGVTSAPDLTSGSSFRIAAPVTVTAGLVALGFGTAFALLGQSNRNESNAHGHCPSANACDVYGAQLRQNALTDDVVSAVSLVAGGALVVTGVTMFLLAPVTTVEKSAAFAPVVSPGFAGVVGRGRF